MESPEKSRITLIEKKKRNIEKRREIERDRNKRMTWILKLPYSIKLPGGMRLVRVVYSSERMVWL